MSFLLGMTRLGTIRALASACMFALALSACSSDTPVEDPGRGGARDGGAGGIGGAHSGGGSGAQSAGANGSGGVLGAGTGGQSGASPSAGSGNAGIGGGSGSGAVGGTAGSAGAGNGSNAGGWAGAAGASGTSAGGAGGGASEAGQAGLGGAGGGAAGAGSGDPTFWIFLLLGQSNMVGAPQPQTQDREQDPRIRVLAYDNCTNVNREYDEWYTASPPLHTCDGGVGPGDYFSKTLIDSLPEGHTIGLVPCAVNGAPIDLFRKGVARTGWTLPPDNHWETGYEWIISRAQKAQQAGVIRGILLHQGESDNGQSAWVGKVLGLVNDLRTDLGLGEVPFLAGELYHGGCCPGHNTLVQQLADEISNTFIVSASGLGGVDQYHFDLPGQRELGTRYGNAMREALMLP